MPEDNNTVKIEFTERSDKKEMTGVRKWLSENLLLLGTLCGVAVGAIIGKSATKKNFSR